MLSVPFSAADGVLVVEYLRSYEGQAKAEVRARFALPEGVLVTGEGKLRWSSPSRAPIEVVRGGKGSRLAGADPGTVREARGVILDGMWASPSSQVDVRVLKLSELVPKKGPKSQGIVFASLTFQAVSQERHQNATTSQVEGRDSTFKIVGLMTC